MKIVFLDFDGVLCTAEGYRRRGTSNFDPPFSAECCSQLSRIVETTNAKIVLTTAWRSLGSVKCGEYLRSQNLEIDLVGCTPWVRDAPRWLEIDAWVDVYRRSYRSLESYVIIDDDPEADDKTGRFVQTNPVVGLTFEKATDAILLLETPL